MTDSTISISGVIEEIIYSNSNNGYTVFEFATDDELITAVGSVSEISVGEKLTLRGEWTFHPSFGRQFKIECCERSLPNTVNDLFNFLSSGIISGVRSKTAKKIIDRFGEESFEVLENHPEILASINGISLEKAFKISEDFKKQISLRRIIIELERCGFNSKESIVIYKKYGVSCIDIIRNNPYILCFDDLNISFDRIEEIAMHINFSSDKCRLQGLIVYILKHNVFNGHTCLPVEKVINLCNSQFSYSIEEIKCQINFLINEKNLVLFNMNNSDYIFLPELYNNERRIADRILLIKKFPPAGRITLLQEIEDIENDECIVYDDNQKRAIITAVKKGFLILTGGPGTGKTTTLKCIINLFKKEKLNIQLAAPTGRAAKRMTDVTGIEARTIHRLLEVEYDKNDRPVFSRNIGNPLNADVLIIDEMSMVDINLFSALLDAVPLGCRIILVGDSNQLPSVGPGNVLTDLIESGIIDTVELNRIFRQSEKSKIVTNAHKIINNLKPDIKSKDSDFFFLKKNNSNSVTKTVLDLYLKRLPAAFGYNSLLDIQILSPSRKGSCGINNLNSIIQNEINPHNASKNEFINSGRIFRTGDKVMQVKNNYNILWTNGKENGTGIFNGDIGIIKTIDNSSGLFTVEFDDSRTAEYSFDIANELELAYAMTVHKSQGNEFNCVIIPLFSVPQNLSYRNLIYTAITRAKSVLIIVGSDRAFFDMCDNNKITKRYSSLLYFLKNEYEI